MGNGRKEKKGKRSPTRSPVDVVQVADAVLVRPVAGLAVEAWLPGAPGAGVLDDHGLAQVLFELEVLLSPFHELGGLWEVLLLCLDRLLAWREAVLASRMCVCGWSSVPCFMRSSFSCIRNLSSSSFWRAFSAYSSLSHFLRKSVSAALAAYAPCLLSAIQ
jgi:hypothetical protein